MSNHEPNKVIFSMVKVSKLYDKKPVLKDIYLSFFYGAKIGVLGLNGSGKSSLLRIIAGVDAEINGEVVFSDGYSVGYLEQEPELDGEKTVKEIVEEAVSETKDLLKEFDEINAKFAEEMTDDEMSALLERQGEVQNALDASDAWDLDSRLDMAMDALRCPPPDTKTENLSGGEKRRVALCRLLLQKPDILLLDEPTNHLDAETVSWLEQHLQKYEGTIIAVTHDRYFLDNVAGWILELDRGRAIPYEGNYSSWLEQKEQRLAQEAKQEAAHQKAVSSELEWVRQGQKGRQSKSKARLKQFEEMNSKEFQTRNETQEIYIPPGPRLGDKVIDAVNISKAYGDKVLFENLSFSIPQGAIVGIIGGNGAGKSTLFKMISGEEKPDSGEIEIGSTVELAYVNQSRDLNGDKTVFEELSDGQDIITVGNYQTPSRAYCGRFNFKGGDQQKFVKDLSGGERNRLHMAKLLKEGGNVLLLDEPTNDLDIETLRALEEAILAFPGCAVVISHDRWFLDRICTHMLAYEGDSKVEFFEGNYTEYQDDYKRRYGKEHQPERIKYKRMVDLG